MAHLGAWPVDETTPVGMFRSEIADDVPQNTPTDGPTGADFEFFSDVYLTNLLAANTDYPDEAVAKALDTMARRLMIDAENIQVDDIKINTEARAKLFSEHAAQIRAAGLKSGGENFAVTPMYTTGLPHWPGRFSDVG